MNLLEHTYLSIGFPVNQACYIFRSYHTITLCPCTAMLMVFTVSSFLFFSVLLFLWLAETGKYENIVNLPQ